MHRKNIDIDICWKKSVQMNVEMNKIENKK